MAARFRAALFDLDGTLLDTEPAYYQAYEAVATALGKPYSDAFHVQHLLGRPERLGVAAFLSELGVAGVSVDELLEMRDKHLLDVFPATPALPGALAAVQACKAAGLPCAVATSSLRTYTDLKLRANGELAGLVDAILCIDDALMHGKRGKPEPDIFHAAAAAIGVGDAAGCVVFEDSLAGIQAGKAAGAFVVAVPDPRIPREAVLAAGADLVLSSLAEFTAAHLSP